MLRSANDPREQPEKPGCFASAEAEFNRDSLIRGRLRIVLGVLLLGLLSLAGALGYWQLTRRSEELRHLQRRQSERHSWIPVQRGAIRDREGRILAEDRIQLNLTLDLALLRREALQRGLAFDRLHRAQLAREQFDFARQVVGRSGSLDTEAFERHFKVRRNRPFLLFADLSDSEASAARSGIEGKMALKLTPDYRRVYPHGALAAHALGRVKRSELPTRDSEGRRFLSAESQAGDFGVEKQFDESLRGNPGVTCVRIDSDGFVVDEPRHELGSGAKGSDIVLSLDLDLQAAAEAAMNEVPGVPRGAAVAISVQTGEVLALASKPDFDLNTVALQVSPTIKATLDTQGAWFNRTTQALYPPGSISKIFTVLAGLRGRSLRPETAYSCSGHLDVSGRRFACHRAEGHGRLQLDDFLAHSCNVFAYRAGLAAGPDALVQELLRFHFETPTGIDLPNEATRMLVPSPSWKQETVAQSWTAGDTINLAIGQGFLRITPLQAACAMASLARRESLTVPTLLHSPKRPPTGLERDAEPLDLPEGDYRALVAAMEKVVENGIGRDAQVPGVTIAGKTGTAQIQGQTGMMNIAWFLAFAPSENPEIAVAVAMEGSVPNVEFAGAEHAAPIVREIIGTYFDKKR